MKINYGIYIGTTSASIAKMEVGEPVVILSSDFLKNTTPVAVAINAKGNLFVGDKALLSFRIDRLKKSDNHNSFIEFTRTLGTDKKYFSSYANRSFSAEELLAEVIQRLLSYERDQNVSAAVITIPSSFKSKQIDAVRKAGYLAGLKQVEIITDDQAAALSYGLDAKRNNGFSLVFKFTSNDFNTALIKSDNGFLSVIDTEGDNYLGGKNLDYAIVDQLIIPHIQENFSIDKILDDDNKKAQFRSALKFFAEEIKNKLCFDSSYNVYASLGECGEDDEGEEIEIDLTVTQEQLKNVFGPIFQRSINNCSDLLKRNNLNGSDLNSLILAGKPTYSPILRDMLSELICEPDTSIDPVTVIVKGAAIYASTIDLKDELKNLKRDRTKIQLEIGHEASTVETEEFVTLKILEDKTEDEIPEKVFAEIKRGDNAWTSGQAQITTVGEVIEVILEKGNRNTFKITLFDERCKRLECEPSSFTILHYEEGYPIVLPYNIGIAVKNEASGELEFRTIKGLEKSKQLPSIGSINNVKISNAIRPGVESDVFELAIYQGELGAEGTRAIYNHHVNTIVITGADIPALVPANSDIDIQIKVDVNQRITALITFPHLDYTFECDCDTVIEKSGEEQANYILNEIKKGLVSVNQLKLKGIGGVEIDKAEKGLEEIKAQFEKDKLVADKQQQILEKLRKILMLIDNIEAENQWPEIEKELKEAFYNLEEINKKKGNEQTTKILNDIKPNVDQAIRDKDKKNTPALIEMINTFIIELKKEVSLSKDEVEDLLFKLTEEGLIPAKAFQEFYEQLSNMNGNAVLLEKLNSDIKAFDIK
jgi:molecular chaperone DnaK